MATNPDRLDPTAPERRFSPVQILVGVLAAVLLLLLVYFFLLRSDGDDLENVAPPPAPESSPIEEEEVETPTKRDPVETFEVFAPKDPFDPLISASAELAGADGAAAAAGDDDAAAGGGDGTTTTTTGEDGTTTTTIRTGGGGDPGGDDVGGHRVRVIDVFARGGRSRAQVQVDGTVYTVDEDERFAQNFQLMSTSGQCATMLFGDDEFTLCEGEEILK